MTWWSENVVLRNPNCTHTSQPVTILHVPKSGGTTICNFLKQTNVCVTETMAWGNCWVFTDGPEWCCDFGPAFQAHGGAREKTCEDRRAFPNAFSMIERYMDTDPATNRTQFCDGIRYGITLRNAVSRAASHAHHFVTVGPALNARWKRALAELMGSRPAAEAQQFLDDLDSLPAGALSPASRRLVNRTFGFWSLELERAAYKLNAFTSNYLVRMLLGRQLGEVPLLASSRAITGEKLAAARWALDQFDFVLHTKGLLDPAFAPTEKLLFGGALSASALVAPDDAIYERIKGPLFRSWLERRNALDAALVDATPARVPDTWVLP